MAECKVESIGIKGNDTEPGVGQLHSQLLSSNERMTRAWKALGICWGLALLSLPLIIAHWVLVPGFLIAGPIVAYKRYHTGSFVEKAAGICPECGEDITIKLEPNDKIPKWTYCPVCKKPLQLVYHSVPSK